MRFIHFVFELRAVRPVGQNQHARFRHGKRGGGVELRSFTKLFNFRSQQFELLRSVLGQRLRRVEFLNLLLDLFDFGPRLRRGVRQITGDDRSVLQLDTRQHARQTVVVVLCDWIKLVIVTPSTRDCQPKKRRTNCFDTLLPLFGNNLLDDVLVELQFLPIRGTQSQETERRRVGWLKTFDQVSGQLLADELVIRQVFVERFHDPITIQPRLRRFGAPLFQDVRVSRQIKPVSPPTFAIIRRREVSLDESFVSLFVCVGDKLIDLILSRRQPEQIEFQPPNQHSSCRHR